MRVSQAAVFGRAKIKRCHVFSKRKKQLHRSHLETSADIKHRRQASIDICSNKSTRADVDFSGY